MSNEPLDLLLIEQRIKDQVQQLELVGGGADFAAVEQLRNFRTPSIYVVTEKESIDINDEARHTYRVTSSFGVIIAVKHKGDKSGKKVMLDARPIIGKVREALIGWKPTERQFQAVAWLRGEVLDYDKDKLLWVDIFQTHYFIEGKPS